MTRIANVTNWLTEAALIGMVTITPWLFGGVQSRVQAGLLAAVTVTLVVWLAGRLAHRSAGQPIPAALVPLLLMLALGGLQLVPLAPATLAVLSPRAAEYRQSLDGPADARGTTGSARTDTSQALARQAADEAWPLSLYPAGTRRELALLAMGTIVFFLASRVFQTPRARLWLYGLVALNGAAVTLFGLAQKLTWNERLYWSVPLRRGGGPFGPFVNQNNAGGYLNLCLAAALGLVVCLVLSESSPADESAGRGGWRAPRLGLGERLRRFLAGLDGLTLTALSLTGCIAAGVLCSLSRGAFLGMVCAAAVTAIVLGRAGRISPRMWLAALVGVAGLGLVAWVGQTELVSSRLQTLLDQDKIAQHDLLPHWQDAWAAGREFVTLGAGLGSYRFVYEPFEQRAVESIFFHAENCYLEAVVAGGVGLLVLGLVLVGLLSAAGWRLVRSRLQGADLPLGVVTIFALSSQCVCLFFDFGLFIPANLILLALLGGVAAQSGLLIHGGSRSRVPPRREAPVSARPAYMGARPYVLLLALGLAVLGGWGWRQMSRVARLDQAMDVLYELDNKPGQPEARLETAVLEAAIPRLGEALVDSPDDVDGQLGLANLWIALYRVRTWSQLQQAAPEDADPEELWAQTATELLHAQAYQEPADQAAEFVAALRRDPLARQHLLPAWEHIVQARHACVLAPDAHVLAAQLGLLVGDPVGDAVHVQRARRLAGGNAWLHLECGLLDFQARRWDSAYASFRRVLTLAPQYVPNIFGDDDEEFQQPDVVLRVLPDSAAMQLEVCQTYYAQPEQAAVRSAILTRVEQLLARGSLPAGEREYLQGEVHALRGQPAEAIASLARAVQSQPRQLAWRFRLATLLGEQGRWGEARDQARILARAAPENRAYRELLDKIIQAQLKR